MFFGITALHILPCHALKPFPSINLRPLPQLAPFPLLWVLLTTGYNSIGGVTALHIFPFGTAIPLWLLCTLLPLIAAIYLSFRLITSFFGAPLYPYLFSFAYLISHYLVMISFYRFSLSPLS